MHGVAGIGDCLALFDEEGGFAVGAAAEGEDRVDFGRAAVSGDDGVEPEDFVDDHAQIFHVFDLGVGGFFAVELVDFGVELLPDVLAFGEDEEEVTHQAGGGVAAGNEDVEELGADLDGVLGAAGEFVEENVAFSFF